MSRKTKSRIFSVCIYAAMLLFVVGLLYFGYLMVMRAQWRSLKNDIAGAMNAARTSSSEMSCGGETLAFTEQDELYFSKFISDPYLLPIKAGEEPENNRSVLIRLGTSTLTFTPCEDETIFNIRLDTESDSKAFFVRSPVGFSYLERYFISRLKYSD